MAVQMSNTKASLSELGSKLVASHSQHCEAAARSETTICGLNEKYGKASGELAVLRSAVEAAALEQERAEGQMKRLQHDLDARTKDLHEVRQLLSCRTIHDANTLTSVSVPSPFTNMDLIGPTVMSNRYSNLCHGTLDMFSSCPPRDEVLTCSFVLVHMNVCTGKASTG